MRLHCHFCGKSVSNEEPEETAVRALLVCPECIEAKRVYICGLISVEREAGGKE